jgi:lysophospholipase L1-like esterase
VATRSRLALVDGKQVFNANLGRIQAGALYPEEAAYQRSIYGDEVMAAKTWLFVTSDGCHPHRTGTSLLADALTAAIQKSFE